ncbi:MAG: GDSL family lipase [Clostridia bacterium]|nr:GDSL family lipase [Clostridia bacterium]
MKIRDKIKLDRAGLEKYGPITIVAFGDSVTHGALGPGEISYETVYHNRLKQKINAVRNYVPVNVINAGIGGITAKGSLGRIDSQVLKHEPDLVIVCFGLNDVNGSLEDYVGSLKVIFEKTLASGAEVIFMTPNMLNTYVHEKTAKCHYNYAKVTARYQNEGRMDTYIAEAVKLAKNMGVTVCDCYSKWKELSKTEDVTEKLVNYINHPTSDMHELFAESLFEIILGEDKESADISDTMYNGN